MSVPEVEVAIPVHGRWPLVAHCLASLLRCTRAPYRVHLLDDGSPESTRRELADWAARHGARLSRHQTPLGFVQTANRAMQSLRGDVLVLLNSDTELTPGWLQRSLAWLVPGVGPLMPLSNNASHYSLPLPAGQDLFGLAELLAARHPRRAPPLVTAAGFCLLLTRSLIERVGVFDPAYGRGYGEESDYCMRCHAVGMPPRAAPDVFVYHHGGASFGSFKHGPEASANRERFFARWGPAYRRLLRAEDTSWLQQLYEAVGARPHGSAPVFEQALRIWARAGAGGLLREVWRAAPHSWRRLWRSFAAHPPQPVQGDVLFVCDRLAADHRLASLFEVHNALLRQGVRARLGSLVRWDAPGPPCLSGPVLLDSSQTRPQVDTLIACGVQARRWVAERLEAHQHGFDWHATQPYRRLEPLQPGALEDICTRLVEKLPPKP